MLKAINTKIFLAILAVLIAIGAELVHIRHADEKAAAILQQQRDATDAAKKHDADIREFIRKQHETHNNMPANGSKTWNNYLP